MFSQNDKMKELIGQKELDVILNRLCCELIENHGDFSESVIIGLQPRGVKFADKIAKLLLDKFQVSNVKVGSLDITFFRDDFRRRDEPLKANQTKIDFLVEEKNVIFVDDVLYTGRSVRSAMDAINSFGRAKSLELAVLIDRRFSRELPIQPDYSGRRVDAIAEEKVQVNWGSEKEKSGVYIIRSNGNE